MLHINIVNKRQTSCILCNTKMSIMVVDSNEILVLSDFFVTKGAMHNLRYKNFSISHSLSSRLEPSSAFHFLWMAPNITKFDQKGFSNDETVILINFILLFIYANAKLANFSQKPDIR